MLRVQGDRSCAIADGATRTATQAAAAVAAYREARADEFDSVPTLANSRSSICSTTPWLSDRHDRRPTELPHLVSGMTTATAIAQIAAKAATGSTAAILPTES